jgi:hypothetical protein
VSEAVLIPGEVFDGERRIAHQRRIREEFEQSEPRAQATSLVGYTIQSITRAQARPLILRYEWLGNVGRSVIYVGLFSPYGELQGVACFGSGPAGSMTGRLGGRALCLERGACVHYAPPNAASYLINRACKLVARLTKITTFYAYGDPCAGEYGGVYQAAGWAYLGQGLQGLGKPNRPRRYFVLPPGANRDDPAQWKTSRSLRRTHRMSFEQARAAGWEIGWRDAKHVYATNVGRDRKRWRAALGEQPYPAPDPERKRKP